MRKKVLILGAAGRDFHNFNTYFRDNADYEVVAFTATQIPDIAGRKYPAELAGKLYPNGIPIYPEEDMAGKSQTTRRVLDILRNHKKKVISIRHPMPYGDLVKQKVQRYATYSDLDKYECTIEEREEYEPHIDRGGVIYSGVDYEAIVRQAESENPDVILWDGGNNDFSFYKPDLLIVVADPHRPGHEKTFYPGLANFMMANVIVINKEETALPENVDEIRRSAAQFNPNATIVDAASPIFVDKWEKIRGKKVLVIEDGPTLTHGNMQYGAGYVAAVKFGAAEIIDPRPFAVGSIVDTFKKYNHLSKILPAMGYGGKQIKELEETINNSDAELVIVGTPIDLGRVLKMNKPSLRVRYELEEIGKPNLEDVISDFLKSNNI